MEPFATAEFYEESPPEIQLQGDIFMCPSAHLVAVDGRELPPGLPDPPDATADIGKAVYVPAWTTPAPDDLVPGVLHATRWGPVMVLSHECELQKDFNALVRHLVKGGMPQEAAVNAVVERVDLDRFAVVTPLVSYDELLLEWPEELRTDARLEDVHRGARVSYLPLPAHPDGLWKDAVVSLGRATTVERRLLQPHLRLATLTDAARGVLRHKLERTYATRDASLLEELEAAVGQTITDVRITPLPQKKGDKKQVSMIVYLANGEVLHLNGSPIRPAPGAGPERVIGRALED